MSLIDLWRSGESELAEKHVQQIIAVAGDGRLLDGNATSTEFRTFLKHIPSDLLKRYAEQCLAGSFPDSGMALQDLVNELGRRLGFAVESGRYRGKAGVAGHDGLWQGDDGRSLVVEVKTTDAYRIDLDKLATYRAQLMESLGAQRASPSVLIVVGREDTGGLEAQIRGSRFAWDMRIISVDGLLRLLNIKESVDDPRVILQIRDVLVPREFTRLDAIVELIFSTKEELEPDLVEPDEKEELSAQKQERERAFIPVRFHAECMRRIERALKCSFVKESRSVFLSPETGDRVSCVVSKTHQRRRPAWWFAFHPHQKEALEQSRRSFVALGCGSAERLFLIPLEAFSQWLAGVWRTERDDRFYWHIRIREVDGEFILDRRSDVENVNLTEFLLPPSP